MVLLLLELKIFVLAYLISCDKSYLQVRDKSGNIIYETNGSNLDKFNKYYFERTFGPLKNYDTKLIVKYKQFPFRAWLAATITVPIGTVLLLSFIFKSYFHLFYRSATSYDTNKIREKNILHFFFNNYSSVNIFFIGFIVLLITLIFFFIPDIVNYFVDFVYNFFSHFKIIFIFLLGALIAYKIWITYLKYILAKKNIKGQIEIEKHRLNFIHSGSKEQNINTNIVKKIGK